IKVGQTLRYRADVRTSGILGDSRENVSSAEIDTRVAKIDAAGYTFVLTLRKAPMSLPDQTITFRRSGDIVDADGKPLQNHLSAGPLYDAFFFGVPPEHIAVGTTWNVTLDRPWQFGPAGTATVKVGALDEQAHKVELRVTGTGSGSIGEDAAGNRVSTEVNNRTVSAMKTPQRSKWTSILHLADGIVVDETTTVQTEWRVASSSLAPASTYVEKRTSSLKLMSSTLP
ncbi:MAG: hypothetical protein QOJ39_3863, partial [Candidatus Eremiobacteraeota bacterium]|nr:hypothetical protein [Candidatus Eremiobacteraeota bacterium]